MFGFMPGFRASASIVLISALAAVPACAQRATTGQAAGRGGSTEVMTNEGHFPIRIEEVRGVMQAKLAHTHALFEGLVMEDLVQVAENADDLRLLGESAAFRPHRTVAYGVFSDEFAAVAARIAQHARRGDVESAHRDYVVLTDACMRCHSYLRREHLLLELPGTVSMRR